MLGTYMHIPDTPSSRSIREAFLALELIFQGDTSSVSDLLSVYPSKKWGK